MNIRLIDVDMQNIVSSGDIVITQKNDEIRNYLLVENRILLQDDDSSPDYVLIDLDCSEVRGFIMNDMVEDYIENTLNEKIIKIIPSDEIFISKK